MDKRISRRASGKLMAAAVGATGLVAAQADAGLTIDLRALGVTTTAAGVIDEKNVIISAPADSVTLGVYARVNGTDGINNETFNSAYGLLNSAGVLKGNLAGGVVNGFNDSAHMNGSLTDWDSDGDLDVGLSPTSSSSTGKFFARNATAGGVPLTPINANTGEILIGQFVFTATGIPGPSSTIVNFLRRNNNGGNVSVAALWFEDGSTVNKAPNMSPYGVNPQGVTIVAIPEPTTLGLMALGAIGLLRRRGRTG
jgi:hypothetical protein